MFRLSRAPSALACLLSIPAVTASMPASAGLLDILKPPAVTLTASTASVTEGGQVTVTVRLSQGSLRKVKVPLTLGGSATKGRDYRNDIPASLSFGVLETTRQFTLTTIDDKDVESTETLTIALGTPKNATVGTPGSLSLAIADNDAPALPTLSFSSASASAPESQDSEVQIKLSKASTQTVSVQLAASGSATANTDYKLTPASPASISFSPGQTSKTVKIKLIDDSLVESSETVVLSLSAPSNATLGATPRHTRTIVDNDSAPSAGKWVMGYYVGYNRDLYPVDKVDFSALTHVAVGRITPKADGGLVTNFDIDDVYGPEWAKDVIARAHAAGTKAIVMVGGFGEYENFVAATQPENRARFVQNLVKLANDYGFDGWDLDWEPIEQPDQPAFTWLAQALRSAAPNKLITAPIYWINANFPDEADAFYAQVAPLLDQINVMSYGMSSGYWNWDTWHSSAIYGETGTTPSSIDSTVRNWLRVGVPAAKLGIGIGFYGSCWRGVTQPYQVMKASDDTSGLPRMGNDDNDMSYTNIVTLYTQPGTKKWHEAAKTPYLSSKTPLGPQKCNFVSYEDERSIAEKALYVKQNGLGGAIVWTIDQGYLPNAPEGARAPLMKALKDSFLSP